MKTNTSNKIVDYIREKGQVSAHELVGFLSISPQVVFKQLRKLIDQNQLNKLGNPPKVFYILPSTQNISKDIDINKPLKEHITDRERFEKSIDNLVHQIVREIVPLRIILFGSGSTDNQNPESDIDVLVVVPEGTHRRKTAQLLYRRICGIGSSFDILVATPGDLEKHKNNIGLIYHKVLQNGKELYAA